MSEGPADWTQRLQVRALEATLKNHYRDATQKVLESEDPIGDVKGVFRSVFKTIYGKAETVIQDQAPSVDSLREHAQSLATTASNAASAGVAVLQEQVDRYRNTGELPTEITNVVSGAKDTIGRVSSNIYDTARKGDVARIPDMVAKIAPHIDAILRKDPEFYLGVAIIVGIGPEVLMLPLAALTASFYCTLGVIGFGVGGITGGSPAAFLHSIMGNVNPGSLFSVLQSLGATYRGITLSLPFGIGIVTRVAAIGVAAYIWYYIL